MALGVEGYDVEAVTDGAQALEAVARREPDVILLDIMMPVLDGLTVCRRLRAGKCRTPILMLTARTETSDRVAGLDAGADDYLPKPFDPVILQARLGASLARKRLHDREQLYQKSLERELEIGREIQAHFLPDSLPILPGFDFAARLRSARMVSGDFYDLYPLGGGTEVVAVVGDVCDKGVGAALFMALFRSLLRALTEQSDGARWNERGASRERRRDAGTRTEAVTGHLLRTVTLANDYIAGTHSRSNMFATVFFAIIDAESGLVQYVNAGHEPPAVVGPAGVRRLEPTGPALGLLPGLTFVVGETTLAPGETLVAWTDGVTEAQATGTTELFGEERTLAVAEGTDGTAAELLDRMLAVVDAYAAGAEQADDITLLAVRRHRAGA